MPYLYQLIIKCADGHVEQISLEKGMLVKIGRNVDCDIVLPGDRTRYSRLHATIECDGDGVLCVRHVGNPRASSTMVDGIKIMPGTDITVELGSKISIDETVIEVRLFQDAQPPQPPPVQPTQPPPVQATQPPPVQTTQPSSTQPPPQTPEWEYPMSELDHSELYSIHLFDEESYELIKEVHLSIINELLGKGMLSGEEGEKNLKEVQINDDASRKLRKEVEELIEDHVERTADKLPYGKEADGTSWKITPEQFRQALYDDIFEKLGALTPLLKTEKVTEIMINRYDKVFVEAGGLLYHTPFRYHDEEQLRMVIDGVVASVHRQVNNTSPMVDARLPDGSRVNAVITPLSLDGSSMTIRKFPQKRLHIEDLIEKGSMSKEEAAFLEACVRARKNVLVSGGTGSGKTTLLNVLSSFVHDRERIVTIEDSAELKLDQQNIVRLEARPANAEEKGKITIRDLVINALRMRPDRIIVGECRGAEALDMLQAMNTGHDGSLTTCHANSAVDALMRLENMVLMAGYDLPSKAIKDQIAAALDVVVQLSRMPDGSRKVTEIIEITHREEDVILHTDIFKYNYENKIHQAIGVRPSFVMMQMEEGGKGIVLGDEGMKELVAFSEGKSVILNPNVFNVK